MRAARPGASERGVLGAARRGRRPRVGGLAPAGRLGSPAARRPRVVAGRLPAAAAVAAGLPVAAAGTARPSDLRGGRPQTGADLVDVDLENSALLALASLVTARLQPALDDHPHASLERLGDILGRLS